MVKMNYPDEIALAKVAKLVFIGSFFARKEAFMHENYMAQAIAAAKQGFRQIYTNPLVGAVIVKNGRVIARGAHFAVWSRAC